ncbi:MAG: helicase C-terminal domain-containing protein [Spirochaetota bacterium]
MCCSGGRAVDLFSETAAGFMRREIARAGGSEVLFFGWLSGGMVDRVEVVCRGRDDMVGVPLERAYLPDVVIHNHPGGGLQPSSQDVLLSSRIAGQGVGFFIVDNPVSRVYVVVEPVAGREVSLLDAAALQELVGPGGPFKKADPAFEDREGQREMIGLVCEAFNRPSAVLVEAGTGIGKSLAYLLPAVHWALQNHEKVVVSTNTINLQEQLLHKDLPQLTGTLGLDASFVLMKGRGNYLCLNRFHEARQELNTLIEDEELEQFNAIQGWLGTAGEASLSELPFNPAPDLWEKINAQAGTCLGAGCPYFGECPLNRVRRRAARAHIIVTNHHYLLADAQVGPQGGLLPPFDRLILDEAHNLENAATSYFTRSLTLSMLLKVLGRLLGPRAGKGYLVSLRSRGLLGGGRFEDLAGGLQETRAAAVDVFAVLERFTAALQEEAGAPGGGVFELDQQLRGRPEWGRLEEGMGDLYRAGTGLLNRLASLRDELEEGGEDRAVRQVEGFCGFLIEAVEHINRFLGEDDPVYVRWIEKRRESGIVVSVVEVGDLLRELVFDRMKTLVLTSATLTVEGGFGFYRSRLRLDDEVSAACIPSSFDYDRQMLALIPDDLPAPDHPEFTAVLGRAVADMLEVTGGRAFVLFTSYRMMDRVYREVSSTATGCLLLKQGEGSRRFLLDRFKRETGAALFGTESFWEGVDAPGRALECVMITKLPFRVPTDPITRARSQRILEQGGNPFTDYYLPLAVIKMRQGVGRLIRSRNDRGVVVLFDGRVLARGYGRAFLGSLPTGSVRTGPYGELLEQARAFFSGPAPT